MIQKIIAVFIIVLLSCSSFAKNNTKNIEQKINDKVDKSNNNNTKKDSKNKNSYFLRTTREFTTSEKNYLKKVLNSRQNRLKVVYERLVLKRLEAEAPQVYNALMERNYKKNKIRFHDRIIEECLKQYKKDLKQAAILRRNIVKYKRFTNNDSEKKKAYEIVKKIIIQVVDRQLALESEQLAVIKKAYDRSMLATANRDYFTERIAKERYDNILNGRALTYGGRASRYNSEDTKTGALVGLKISEDDKKSVIQKIDSDISNKNVDKILVRLAGDQLLIMSYLKVADNKLYKELLLLKKSSNLNFVKELEKYKSIIYDVVRKRDEKIADFYRIYKKTDDKSSLKEIKKIIKEQLVERLALEKEFLKVLKKNFEIKKVRYKKRLKNKEQIIDCRVKYLLRDKDLDWR